MTTASIHKLLLSIVLMAGLFLSGGLSDSMPVLDHGGPAGPYSAGLDVPSGQVEVSERACDGECVNEARACSTTCAPTGMPPSNVFVSNARTLLKVSTTSCCLSGLNPALDPAPPKARA